MRVTVVVPTYNEAPNVAELVRRVAAATPSLDLEILFVDDSTDDTPRVIEQVAETAPIPVRMLHREDSVGGLSGAVVAGLQAAHADVCIVMDGDLQHPPEDIVNLVARHARGDVDVVVASRYTENGENGGLSNALRVFVSQASTNLTKALFPKKLKNVTDPMTGFFLVDRTAFDVNDLKPRGFKILLEILARESLRVAEIPFSFQSRHAGESKASLAQGLSFLTQLFALRFGRMSLFAVIGALGAVANVVIMWMLVHTGVNYMVAAIISAEVTIIGNFVLQERFVFHDMKEQASAIWSRFVKSFGFNNAEAAVRIAILPIMVEALHISSVMATAITLVVAFFVRFAFHKFVVYAPRRVAAAPATAVAPRTGVIDELDTKPVATSEV
ncbi:MAG: glycosyl transferase family 2 [Microbacterium sp.]|uniref:Glycosyl transferase family 2 n=1 Tax=Microbacterium ginsengisoli TaxID=400772 RepID=A0A3C1KAH3_9MICO|nr:glycosyltransferase family 2 protein [uncultured Microbacterium sp.]MAL07619.1 glycosyl transferase family 2 [Microbacterium sp.]HAN23463.1 glycosyl transferase family 2 [Microbacterium ginsengisoli]